MLIVDLLSILVITYKVDHGISRCLSTLIASVPHISVFGLVSFLVHLSDIALIISIQPTYSILQSCETFQFILANPSIQLANWKWSWRMKSRITTIISVNSLILSLCFILVPRFWCWPLVVIHNCIQFIISFLFLSLSFLPSKWSVSIWVALFQSALAECSGVLSSLHLLLRPFPLYPFSLWLDAPCCAVCVWDCIVCLSVWWNGGEMADSIQWNGRMIPSLEWQYIEEEEALLILPSHTVTGIWIFRTYLSISITTNGITDTVHHWTHLLLFILPSPYLSSISSHSSSVLISSGTTHSVFSDTIGNYRIVVSSSLSSALSSRWFGFGMFVCRRHRKKNSEVMMAMEQPLPLHSFIIFHLLANGHSHHSPSVILVPGVVMCLQLIICPSLKFKYSKFEIYID